VFGITLIWVLSQVLDLILLAVQSNTVGRMEIVLLNVKDSLKECILLFVERLIQEQTIQARLQSSDFR
jgi:hypothetical protein